MSDPATGTPLRQAAQASSGEEERIELLAHARPVLLAFARRVGLRGGRVEQRTERVLERLAQENGRDAAGDGTTSPRDLLFRLAKEGLADASLAALDPLASEEELRAIWDGEWRRAIVRRALDELYQSSHSDARLLQAFELHCLEHRPANDVATELGMSRTAVFSAKQRLMEHLRERVAELEEEL